MAYLVHHDADNAASRFGEYRNVHHDWRRACANAVETEEKITRVAHGPLVAVAIESDRRERTPVGKFTRHFWNCNRTAHCHRGWRADHDLGLLREEDHLHHCIAVCIDHLSHGGGRHPVRFRHLSRVDNVADAALRLVEVCRHVQAAQLLNAHAPARRAIMTSCLCRLGVAEVRGKLPRLLESGGVAARTLLADGKHRLLCCPDALVLQVIRVFWLCLSRELEQHHGLHHALLLAHELEAHVVFLAVVDAQARVLDVGKSRHARAHVHVWNLHRDARWRSVHHCDAVA